MSDQQGRVTVTLEDLLAQADLLKKQIEDLQKTQNELTETILSIKSAKDVIQELKAQQEVMVSGDKKGYLIFTVEQKPLQKVLVYLGLSYYAETDIDNAIKILDSRENEVNEALQEVAKRLSDAATMYERIADILRNIQEQSKGDSSVSTE
ncbi:MULTISPECIES: prefoldin subunit alpha [Acidianus]|uniref:Prefoldin subunit alpha n=1 Tax=Candidatus Acidianus copahuensis TaxID=1160895 RepID=A0A031LPB2_9CREN|nr:MULTISPECIES: prefoldin subunit alpha [Acidianus]EZQ06907.1 prefoldin subunit alpha [Candidatus Acidianus copahuensis]NON61403.1 prefoldin subunit alpha [Acidianus sp. RZ1]